MGRPTIVSRLLLMVASVFLPLVDAVSILIDGSG